MKRISVLIAVAFSLMGSRAMPQAAQYKGAQAASQEITDRLMATGARFSLATYVPEAQLLTMLGTWVGFQTERVFQYGLPNPASALVWYFGCTDFAQTIGNACVNPNAIKLNQQFKGILARTCRWPEADAKSDDAMMDFWFAMMGYEAPESEFEAWRDFFHSSSYKDRSGEETVRAMSLAILMNPYFLLQH